MVAAAYGPSLQNGFIWDDDDYLTENPTLARPGGLFDVWFSPSASPQYYPLVFSSFWVERRVFGLNPAGFHAVNAALHALAAILLWRLLAALAVPGAWLAAAVFALHPVNVESVAWISERKNVLSGVFYFASAIFLASALDLSRKRAAGKRRSLHYGAALLLFVGALLSKTVTATLPAAALLAVWWKRGRASRDEVYRLLPFFLLAALSGLFTAYWERSHVGARGADFDLGAIERMLLAGRALWFYAGKILWPTGFRFIYPREIPPASDFLSYLAPAGFLAAAALLWLLRRRVGRGPLTALLFFAGTLFPALGFINVYPFRFSFVADHFQYLAAPGLMALTCAAASMAALWIPFSFRVPVITAACLSLLIFLGWTSFRQTGLYRDQETLWERTLAANPGAWIARNNLGAIRFAQGRPGEALALFGEVTRRKPDYAEAWSNMGSVLFGLGRNGEAEALFSKALALDPRLSSAHFTLANLYEAEGKKGAAGRQYALALAAQGPLAQAYEKMGRMAEERGRMAAALAFYGWAVDADPGWAPARARLGTLLAGAGRFEEALPHLAAAYEADPGIEKLALNLGAVYLTLGKPDKAAPVLREALLRDPGNPSARRYLDLALSLSGGR